MNSDTLKGCLGLIILGIVGAAVVAALDWGTYVLTAFGGLVALLTLCVWMRSLYSRRTFLRAAPNHVQGCMATVRDGLAAGTDHLEAAVRELESGIAPLFWDAIDDFPPAIKQCRTAWNTAVDIAQRYERQRPRKATPLMPDASLLATIVELGDKWSNLRRQSLADQHFASIFEQRRQAEKITNHLREQREQIEAAVSAARQAQLVASQALVAAKQADEKAMSADARARSAIATARSARSVASSASWTATSAASVAHGAASTAASARYEAMWAKI